MKFELLEPATEADVEAAKRIALRALRVPIATFDSADVRTVFKYVELLNWKIDKLEKERDARPGSVERFYDLAMAHAYWSQETFGDDSVRGPHGPLKHLLKEVQEAIDKPRDAEEYADLLLLVLDASRRADISAPQLLSAAERKLDKNKSREWGPPDADGVFEHKRN